MKFAYTIVYVPDVQRAVQFYEQAFGLKHRFIHESGEYAEMETGATALAFASHSIAESNLPAGFRKSEPAGAPANVEIAFTTEDVAQAFERATQKGADPLVPPSTKPWGQQVAYVRDLDGNLVELATPMAA